MNFIFCVLLLTITSVFSKSLPSNTLKLTPILKSGDVETAQKQANVKSKYFNNLQSFSGFFTINETYNSNLFFWYFPPIYSRSEAPVILWLQGGPGASSLYGLFSENGPFSVRSGELKPNKYTWNNEYHLVYIDNPVGTGFSYTDSLDGYSETEEQIGKNLYEAILQFFKLFPFLAQNPFYIAGESYAGKYIPALAYQISLKKGVNLQGIVIGNGTPDPYNQMYVGDYLYQLGLIDANERKEELKLSLKFQKLVDSGNYKDATQLKFQIQENFYNATDFSTRFNYLNPNFHPDKSWINYIEQPHIRTALHVGSQEFKSNSETVAAYLDDDYSQSVAPWIRILLSQYRVMFYNGQLDIVSPYPVMAHVIERLNFTSSEKFDSAKRCKWYVGEKLAGYYKRVDNLVEVLVREAGHLVPHDQPAWALDLISKFIANKLQC